MNYSFITTILAYFSLNSRITFSLIFTSFFIFYIQPGLKAIDNESAMASIKNEIIENGTDTQLRNVYLRSVEIDPKVYYPQRKNFRNQRHFERTNNQGELTNGYLSNNGFNYISRVREFLDEQFSSKDYSFLPSTRIIHTYLTAIYANVKLEELIILVISSNQVGIQFQTKWEFTDYYGNDLFQKEFNFITDFTPTDGVGFGGKTNKTITDLEKLVDSAIKEKLQNIDDSEEFNQLRKINVDSLLAGQTETILIKHPTHTVGSLEGGLESTVTIKSQSGHGSGFFISEDGYLISNYHVVRDDDTVSVVTNSGEEYSAVVLRRNLIHDLALLKINEGQFVPFGISKFPPEITAEVFAIGTPASEEFSQTLSSGIISGIRRVDDINTFIQSDVRINPGNSGGPMILRDGSLIGIVNARIFGRNVSGIGFAIPASNLDEVLNISFE